MSTRDDQIRIAAALELNRLIRERGTNVLPWNVVEAGFPFEGRRVKFASRAVGIFKPAELTDGVALSIKQVRPTRSGRAAPYDDRDLTEGFTAYKLERSGRDNRYLEAAYQHGTPLIFLRGVSDATYEVIFPVVVISIDLGSSEAVISWGEEVSVLQPKVLAVAETIERGYSIGERKTRKHQRAFRNRVLPAYGFRCAISGLPIPELLQAAHIVADSAGGEASVRNGIAMSSLHHGAYESHLLGIDPDGKIHLSESIKAARDGPLLDFGLHQMNGRTIRRPAFEAHQPDRDFLAIRFESFLEAKL